MEVLWSTGGCCDFGVDNRNVGNGGEADGEIKIEIYEVRERYWLQFDMILLYCSCKPSDESATFSFRVINFSLHVTW